MHRFFLRLTLAVLAAATTTQAATINVFLLGGQSNMDGRALASELPANLSNQTDVLFYSNNTGGQFTSLKPLTSSGTMFGPEISFGRSMADYYAANGGGQVALIKYAVGGTNLYAQWKGDGTASSANDGVQYQSFQNIVKSGLKALADAHPEDTIVICGMLWMQGESDVGYDSTGTTTSLSYGANLTTFISDIRLTLGLNDLPFIIGKLSSAQTSAGKQISLNNVRAGQEAVAAADPWVGLVNTDTFALKSDNLHFGFNGTNDGQLQLGYAFAAEMQNMLAIPEPSTYASWLTGIGALIAVRNRKGKI